MKRNILIAMAILTLGAGAAARADGTNVPPVLDWNYFQSITLKNIFDPSRSGRNGRSRGVPVRAPVVRYFSFHGTLDDVALFTGEGVPHRGFVTVGDLINGFKVLQVTLHPSVKLADPAGNIVVLNDDESMRREDDGPWTKSDQPAPLVIAPTARAGDPGAVAAPAAGPAGESETLKRLRLKREQEEK